MASASTTNEFAPPGTYSVRLGDSFTSPGSKDASSYYSFKFIGRLDPTMNSRKATLQKMEDDTYAADWGAIEGSADKTELNYDATATKVQDMDCILLFDEASKAFTLQRPKLKFQVRKSRGSRKRKVVEPELPDITATKIRPAPAKRPAQKVEERRSSVDDFAKDIESNMMELLEDDDEDDDDEEVSAAPRAAVAFSDTDTFEEVVHPHKRPSTDSPQAMNRKRKYKMASQPIRRLDDSPQMAVASAVSPVQRREYAGKSISPAVMAANRGKKVAVQSSSESSSESSSSDESGSSSSSGESGSSSSGSEDESSGSGSEDSSDDDMDDLAANITRSLSADTHSVPPSPARPQNTPLVPERSPYSASPAVRGTPNTTGPTSLRHLYGKDDEKDQEDEEGGVTSSDEEI